MTVADIKAEMEETPQEEPSEAQTPPADPSKPMMINIGKPITDEKGTVWHIKRRWKVLTPAICQVENCGFDFLAENGLPEWKELTKGEQDLVLRGMAAHAVTHEHERARVMNVSDFEKMQAEGWPPPPTNRMPATLKTK